MKSLELKIPPPVYAIFIAVIMWFLHKHLPVFQIFNAPWNKIGLGMIMLAVSLDVYSLFLFLKKRTTPNPMKPENTSELVSSGLYKFSRNPMYVGLLIILTGFAVWMGSLISFVMLPVFYWVITEMQIKPEERLLEVKFGQVYLDYKKKVRRWL